MSVHHVHVEARKDIRSSRTGVTSCHVGAPSPPNCWAISPAFCHLELFVISLPIRASVPTVSSLAESYPCLGLFGLWWVYPTHISPLNLWSSHLKGYAYKVGTAQGKESKPLKNKVQSNNDYHFLASISLLTTERRQVLIRETSSVWILSCTRWCCVRTIHSAREKVGLFLATVLPSWACPRMLTFALLPQSFDFALVLPGDTFAFAIFTEGSMGAHFLLCCQISFLACVITWSRWAFKSPCWLFLGVSQDHAKLGPSSVLRTDTVHRYFLPLLFCCHWTPHRLFENRFSPLGLYFKYLLPTLRKPCLFV